MKIDNEKILKDVLSLEKFDPANDGIPVASVEIDGRARLYPTEDLAVIGTVDGRPITVNPGWLLKSNCVGVSDLSVFVVLAESIVVIKLKLVDPTPVTVKSIMFDDPSICDVRLVPNAYKAEAGVPIFIGYSVTYNGVQIHDSFEFSHTLAGRPNALNQVLNFNAPIGVLETIKSVFESYLVDSKKCGRQELTLIYNGDRINSIRIYMENLQLEEVANQPYSRFMY